MSFKTMINWVQDESPNTDGGQSIEAGLINETYYEKYALASAADDMAENLRLAFHKNHSLAAAMASLNSQYLVHN